MTNKEKLRNAIEKDINPNDFYEELIEKIGEYDKMSRKKNTWKLAFVPVCLILIISGILFLVGNGGKTNLSNKPFVDDKNNISLYINEINDDKVGTTKLDADIRVMTDDINFPLPYKKEISLPEDLNKSNNFIVYTRENRDSKDYNILHNYIIEYTNDKDRVIQVGYAKENKPLRDYYFSEEGSKSTTINDVELVIYKFEDSYYTTFEFNGYNFDIETSNIKMQELSTFLASILK